MLNFDCGVEGVPTINPTKDEIEVRYPPHKGNIAEDPEDDMEMSAAVPNPSTHQSAAHYVSLKTPAPLADQQLFSPQPTGRLEALMLKENRTLTLVKVQMEEALTHFDAHASQDEASFDGDMSGAEDNIEVVPDEVDGTQVKSSKPVGVTSATGKKVQKVADKSGGSQTLKSVDKNPTGQPSNKALSGMRDGPVCYDRSTCAKGCRDKYPKDHISVHCVQWASCILLLSCFDMFPEKQKMSDIFFYMDVTLADGSALQGGKWLSVPWYPDTPEMGAAL